MALRDGFPIIAAVDLISFAAIAVITFAANITLHMRKILTLSVFYLLAVFLIDTLGYMGRRFLPVFYNRAFSADLAYPCCICIRSN
jgi:hypothetical protein